MVASIPSETGRGHREPPPSLLDLAKIVAIPGLKAFILPEMIQLGEEVATMFAKLAFKKPLGEKLPKAPQENSKPGYMSVPDFMNSATFQY